MKGNPKRHHNSSFRAISALLLLVLYVAYFGFTYLYHPISHAAHTHSHHHADHENCSLDKKLTPCEKAIYYNDHYSGCNHSAHISTKRHSCLICQAFIAELYDFSVVKEPSQPAIWSKKFNTTVDHTAFSKWPLAKNPRGPPHFFG